MNIDIEHAQQFLDVLTDGDDVTFQTLDDDKQCRRGSLSIIFHGDLCKHAERLQRLNDQGAGVFWMVNRGDGKGRKARNVTSVRAAFADFDGQPLPERWPLEPHAIVESSSGRYHAYWLVSDVPLDQFASIQRAIADHLGSDQSVNDLPRLMRLPGFLHMKNPTKPFQSRVVHTTPMQPYSLEQLVAAFPGPAMASSRTSGPPVDETHALTDSLITDLRDALRSVPAEDRDTWQRMGHALHGLGSVGFELWEEWGRTTRANNYDPQDSERVWGSLCPTSTGYRAVFAEAQRHSWQNPRRKGSRAPVARSRSATSVVELVNGADITPEAVTWLWAYDGGWLASGKLHILGGAPGTGKTTIAMTLAAAMTRGGPWPDGARTEPGDVAIWSGEDGPADTLAPRLLACDADMQRVHFVGDVTRGEKRPFDPAMDMRALQDALQCVPTLRMLILDPIVSAVAGDSHRNAEVRRSLQPVVDLCAATGAAAVGITHFSKGTAGRDPVERLTGSNAFGALPRLIWMAVKDGDGGRMFLRAKNNLGPDGGGWKYTIETTVLEGDAALEVGRIQWGERLDGNARELLAKAEVMDSPDERNATDEAMDWLRNKLSPGPVERGRVREEGKAAGISDKALRRARERLRVLVSGEGFPRTTTWRLPPDDGVPARSVVPSEAQSCPVRPSLRDGTTGHDWQAGAEEGQRAVREIPVQHDAPPPMGPGQ